MGDKHAIADRLVGPERAESNEIEIGLWSRRPSISSYQRNWSRHSGRLITIDRDTHRDLRSILQVPQSAILANTEELATGWGEYHAEVDEFTIGGVLNHAASVAASLNFSAIHEHSLPKPEAGDHCACLQTPR
jgi:hypothetical protein